MDILNAELDDIEWLAPWEASSANFEDELKREIGRDHKLYGQQAISVARRSDRDDVLFYLPDSDLPLAVVHLTWSRRVEAPAQFPHTTFFSSVSEWVERCMNPDHRDWESA